MVFYIAGCWMFGLVWIAILSLVSRSDSPWVVAVDRFVLVAGTGYPGATWGPELVEPLAAHHTVLTFDHRGTGRTPSTPERYSTRGFAADAIALVDALGLPRVEGQILFVPQPLDRMAAEVAIRPDLGDRGGDDAPAALRLHLAKADGSVGIEMAVAGGVRRHIEAVLLKATVW